jgi:hypothetical protein
MKDMQLKVADGSSTDTKDSTHIMGLPKGGDASKAKSNLNKAFEE